MWGTSKQGQQGRRRVEYTFHALALCCSALVGASAIPYAHAATLPTDRQYVAGSGLNCPA